MSPSLDTTLSALADPTRRAILERLARGEATVGELRKPFRMSPPAISQHLKVLEQAGLIEREVRAQFRVIRLNPTPLKAAEDWMHDQRTFWESALDNLEHYLKKGETNDRSSNPTG